MIKDFAKYGGQSKIIFNDDIANGNTNNTNVTTAKKDANLDSLINNVMLLMKKTKMVTILSYGKILEEL